MTVLCYLELEQFEFNILSLDKMTVLKYNIMFVCLRVTQEAIHIWDDVGVSKSIDFFYFFKACLKMDEFYSIFNNFNDF